MELIVYIMVYTKYKHKGDQLTLNTNPDWLDFHSFHKIAPLTYYGLFVCMCNVQSSGTSITFRYTYTNIHNTACSATQCVKQNVP